MKYLLFSECIFSYVRKLINSRRINLFILSINLKKQTIRVILVVIRQQQLRKLINRIRVIVNIRSNEDRSNSH